MSTTISKKHIQPLEVETIATLLANKGLNGISDIQVFSSLASTNDYLLENQSACDQVAVCLAEQQTQGRGRYGHRWNSPAGVNVYLSLAWPTQDLQKQYDVLSLWLLLAIAEVLARYDISNVQLKWPNDICVENKKLAGVLLERKISQSIDQTVNRTKSNLVIGVGLNVAMSQAEPVELQNPWIDLLMINPNWNISRNEIAADLISSFYKTIDHFEQGKLESLAYKWTNYDMLMDKQIEYLENGKSSQGRVIGIEDSGNLVLNRNGKQMSLHSSQVKEIKII